MHPREAYEAAMGLRADHGWGSTRIAREVGLPQSTVAAWLYRGVRGPTTRGPMGRPTDRPGRVPNGPLRDAFLRSRLSAWRVAAELGWWRKPQPARGRPEGARIPDEARVRSALGLKASRSRYGVSVRRTVPVDVAEALAKAIGVDPWEVGV